MSIEDRPRAMSGERPLRILMSAAACEQAGGRIDQALDGRPWSLVEPGEDADIAFLSRDVTGASTKHTVLPETQRFYDGLLGAASLRWLHIHSAGADRPTYLALMDRGVQLTTSTGANASIVVQSALAGILSLARGFPQLGAAQREWRWAPLLDSQAPRDLAGQTATVVGWGAIAQLLANFLKAFGMRLNVLRSTSQPAEGAVETLAFEGIADVAERTDWLIVACPLTPRTQGLVSEAVLSSMPLGSHLANIARGEIVDEPALVKALASRRLAGAYLDVFAKEPLSPTSALWSMEQVIVTPHCAGQSTGNNQRVIEIFLDNLRRWHTGEALRYNANRL